MFAGMLNIMINTNEIFEFDKSLLNENVKLVAGMDEVGRGPLAGPVVTCCIVMPYNNMIEGVYDSKKLTAKKRDELYDKILNTAIDCSITLETSEVIDEINILQATKKSMEHSFNELKVKPDLLLVDAVKGLNINIETKPIIKGDATSYAIACASIIAKVYRDRLMDEYAKIYPHFGFENNKGYGTKAHIEGLKKYGKCPIHRNSFISHFV